MKGHFRPQEYQCNGIYPRSAHRKTCGKSSISPSLTFLYLRVLGYTHIAGSGVLSTRACEVHFMVITPRDPNIPYVLLYSRGVHIHPPAYADKTPLILKKELEVILREGAEKSWSISEF